MSEANSPTLREVLAWLLGITKPVHSPLLVSTALRVISLSLDLALFATAAGGVIRVNNGGDGLSKLVATLVVLSLAKALAFYGEQFTGHFVAFKALELLRGHVFATMWPKAPYIVSHSRSGDLLTSLTRDVDRIEVVYAHTFAPVVSAYIVGAGAVAMAGFWVGWGVVWIAAICLAVSLLVVPYLGTRTAMARTRDTLAQRRNLTHHVSDTIHGLDEVLGYGRGVQRLEEMDELGAAVAQRAVAPRDLMAIRRGANVTLSVVAAMSIVVLGWEELTAPALAALAAASLRIFEGPRGIEDATGYLDHSLAAARRLWEICHAPQKVSDGSEVLVLDKGPEVRFGAVSYVYPTGGEVSGSSEVAPVKALEDVSFTVSAGTHAVIVGRSGSGKSTLVQLLQRYDDPTLGAVSVDGHKIGAFTLDSLRRSVVSVSQKNQLLQGSIAENLRLATPQASDAQLWRALDIAGLADEIRAMPEGLDTHVGRSSVALSGGQVQRLCLARAVLMDPKVLILDEFTANLNVELEVQIRSTLRSALPGVTIIEVTHRLQGVELADIVVVLDRGRLIASGPPSQLLDGGDLGDIYRLDEVG
ncbi:MAG: ABC transporter ATP-binding protein [Acidimicrobiales bacterium]|nr:ABC transporter ATP-binding protein [Acidimicrobiales bacterium]